MNEVRNNEHAVRAVSARRRVSRGFYAALACAGLSACASSPDELTAQHVSPLRYEAYTCKQIVGEMDYTNERLGQLYSSLDDKAADDATQMGLGLVLFWPALFFLEGGDGPEAIEYTRLRGESDAMRRAAIMKECDLAVVRNFTPPAKTTHTAETRTPRV